MISRRWLFLSAVALVVAGGFLLLRHGQAPLTGPQPVAWDREACASCRMLVSEPGFAAQLVEPGRALHFDDPGCLLAYLGDNPPAGELWFHHRSEDRWIPGHAVAFVAAAHSPMGHGLAAVDSGTPGAISLDEARRRVSAHAMEAP